MSKIRKRLAVAFARNVAAQSLRNMECGWMVDAGLTEDELTEAQAEIARLAEKIQATVNQEVSTSEVGIPTDSVDLTELHFGYWRCLPGAAETFFRDRVAPGLLVVFDHSGKNVFALEECLSGETVRIELESIYKCGVEQARYLTRRLQKLFDRRLNDRYLVGEHVNSIDTTRLNTDVSALLMLWNKADNLDWSLEGRGAAISSNDALDPIRRERSVLGRSIADLELLLKCRNPDKQPTDSI
jgi:hypothetical protein